MPKKFYGLTVKPGSFIPLRLPVTEDPYLVLPSDLEQYALRSGVQAVEQRLDEETDKIRTEFAGHARQVKDLRERDLRDVKETLSRAQQETRDLLKVNQERVHESLRRCEQRLDNEGWRDELHKLVSEETGQLEVMLNQRKQDLADLLNETVERLRQEATARQRRIEELVTEARAEREGLRAEIAEHDRRMAEQANRLAAERTVVAGKMMRTALSAVTGALDRAVW